MGVFYVFLIVNMIPIRAKQLYFNSLWLAGNFYFKSKNHNC